MGRPAINEIGNSYNRLVVVDKAPPKGRHAAWLCRCCCGNKELVYASGSELRTGVVRSCGCDHQSRLDDLTGKVFGQLTVVRRGANFGTQTGWLCKCSCGNAELINARASQLKKNITTDCGCSSNPYGKGIYGPFLDRATAKAKGLSQYFPGTACPQGHIAARSTHGGGCLLCHRDYQHEKQQEGYFREREKIRRETDPEYHSKKARHSRDSYHRHKNDPGAAEKRKDWYAKHKDSDWYKESTKKAQKRFVDSGKKAESDKRYSESEAGMASRDKARKQWREKFEKEKGIPVSSWRLKNDPQFKLHSRLNTRISQALKKQGVVKAAKTAELIDAEIADFRAYLAANWEEGMSWENYGRDGWHVDHIRPCASFDLTDTEQQLVCFNWRNLRPMWGAANVSKSDNYDHHDEEYWSEMMRDLGYEGELFLLYS